MISLTHNVRFKNTKEEKVLKKMNKLVVMLVAVFMLAAVFAGCTSNAPAESSSSEAPASSEAASSEAPAESSEAPAESSEAPAESSESAEGSVYGEPSMTDTYTIGYNNFGKGAYPIDIVEADAQYYADIMGNTLSSVNNEFKAEKIISDVQSLISAGVDGMVFMGPVETTIPTAAEMLNQANIPFVMHDKIPSDQSVMDAIQTENPMFAGAVAPKNYDAGVMIGEAAAADGNTTAIIVGAVQGDTAHDDRIAGFTEAFEAAGGQVLGVAHCADPTEGVTKATDLITANSDADCVYGSGGDYSNAAISALANFPDNDMKIYGTDIDPDLVDMLADGKVAALNGGFFVESGIASALLQNYLDGHPILDPDGNPPVFTNLNMILLPADQADLYKKYWIDGHPLTEDQYKSLTWRYNPDVSYDTFNDLCSTFSLETVAIAHGE